MRTKERVKTEFIGIRVTPSEKIVLEQRARAAKKSLSEFLVESAMNAELDTPRTKFYNKQNKRFDYLLHSLFVQTKLILLLLHRQGAKTEEVKDFHNKALNEAERFFGEVDL